MAYPSTEKLVELIADAGINNGDLKKCIDNVVNNCEICCLYKKARPRPVVTLPLASKFNELLAFDLEACGEIHFLVKVDHATRFCSAMVITNKED